MTNAVRRLWTDREVPIVEGVYTPDGRGWEAWLDRTAASGFTVGEPIDVDALLADNPGNTTSADATFQTVEIPGEGYLCCGEGTLGAEGWVAKLDLNSGLVWVVHFDDSNPFVELEVDGDRAHCLSSSGVRITVGVRGGWPGPPL
ncbi:hypothetical protein FEK35_10025 [Nocardia cyriacigeorgica]|uniref:Uncharacterized protein n=1 Tax=Nocardia cyriacigeorgica TaxID=135487 RepID=A0A5R8PGQ4_9NOCA|nr:hypothetical protein [Nocardia cyriacigeorgica]TLG13476.1 hypothetical protein FEK35_10025 [Nocardia cyriacigeorgica]